MFYGDQQEYAHRGSPGVAGCTRRAAGLCPPQKPQEVHPAATARLPDRQGVPASGLSRHARAAGRMVRPARGPRLAARPALHHALCGQPASAPQAARGPDAREHSGVVPQRQAAHEAVEAGGHRLDGLGVAARLGLLHASVRAAQRARQAPLSEALGHLRHGESPDPGGGDRSRPEARLCRGRADACGGLPAAALRDVGRGCRLRVRTLPRHVPTGVGHSEHHPDDRAWPQATRWTTPSGDGLLSEVDAAAVPEGHVRPAVADRDGLQHAQAESGLGIAGATLPQPDAGDPSPHLHPRPHDPLTPRDVLYRAGASPIYGCRLS